MFDINLRKDLSNSTVAELIDALQKLRPSAAVYCCGDNHIFLHVEKDGSAVNLDMEDLDGGYACDPTTSPDDYWRACQGELKKLNGATKKFEILSRWKRRLRELCEHICGHRSTNRRRDGLFDLEFTLLDRLRCSQESVVFLKIDLKEAKKQNNDMVRIFQNRFSIFANILIKSDVELRNGLRSFEVRKAETHERWEVATGRRGPERCDTGIYDFATERDALIFATLLDMTSIKPFRNTSCATCSPSAQRTANKESDHVKR